MYDIIESFRARQEPDPQDSADCASGQLSEALRQLRAGELVAGESHPASGPCILAGDPEGILAGDPEASHPGR